LRQVQAHQQLSVWSRLCTEVGEQVPKQVSHQFCSVKHDVLVFPGRAAVTSKLQAQDGKIGECMKAIATLKYVGISHRCPLQQAEQEERERRAPGISGRPQAIGAVQPAKIDYF